MTVSRSTDPRYLINIKIGADVIISEDYEKNAKLVPCRVKRKISTDAIVELGVRVECEDGKIGRVKFIGEEAEYEEPEILLTILEKKLRTLIEEVLSQTSENWWQYRITNAIQKRVKEKNEQDEKLRKLLDISEFSSLEQTDFTHLETIIIDGKNSQYFQKVFGEDKSAIRIKLSELSSLRNIVAHNKELTNLEIQKIRVYFHDIDYQIKRYNDKKSIL